MANTNTVVKQTYACNGSTQNFAIPFFFIAGEESVIKVYLIDNATLVATLLSLTTHYTLNSPATTVTTVATYASGKSIQVKRVSPQIQTSEYIQGPFPFQSIEDQFDRVVSLVQETSDSNSNFLALPVGVSSLVLPAPSANKVLGWNAGATALENKSESNIPAILSDITILQGRALALENQDITTIAKDVTQDGRLVSLESRMTIAEANFLIHTVDYTQLTGSQVIHNNQVAPEPIVQLHFDGDGTQLANIEIQIHRRTSIENRFSRVKLIMLFDIENLTWYLGREATTIFAGESDGLVFSVATDANNVGLVSYVSDNMAGTGYTGYLKFLGKEIPSGV